MSWYRFFVAPSDVQPGPGPGAQSIAIGGDEAQHLASVLRLRIGDEVVVCDGTGWEYRTVLEAVGPRSSVAGVVECRRGWAEPANSVHLFVGLTKSDKLEFVMQKCTELGVSAIHPVTSEHSVVRVDGAKAETRRVRWGRIAVEAAKQCGRAVAPEVYPVTSLSAAVASCQLHSLLIPWEKSQRPLRESLGQWEANRKSLSVGVVIGPEGGLADKEVAELEQLGGTSVSLGQRILRTETACIATVALVMYALGDLGEGRDLDVWR